ncbi:MAG: phosphocarrier protein HPr [Fusobacteriia bacterium 4572_132]|nr:MAG: phosphocarrier protein HPr [Fusobacteriia bacterium 4572_132]
MKEIEVEIKNVAGLHARPSALLVQLASRFEAEITLISSGEEVNGKSIMGLMLLAAEKGRKITLKADGEDEEEALNALKKLIEVDKFNEE